MRGFLQVQSSATLPHDSFQLKPIDLYNLLRHLRMNADQKGKRRGVRIELIPGEAPLLVLEPWETVIRCSGDVYQGRSAKVVRIWGRRRLMLLKSFLPFMENITVHLLGSGLPSFWVCESGEMSLTLGLTGFTAANWSQAAHFDLLLPRKTQESAELTKVVQHLSSVWKDDLKGLEAATKLKGEELREALQLGCQQGQLMYDLANDVYRLRPLTNQPLDLKKLEYRNVRERQAHDYISRKKAVTIEKENRILGTGVELTGKVIVEEDRRDYRPQILVTEEGNVSKAECTCTLYRTQKLTAGPCEHLIALRLLWAQQQIEWAQNKGKKRVVVETRSYSKRDAKGEHVFQITLDRNQIQMNWGLAGQTMRQQRLQFNSNQEALSDYQTRPGGTDSERLSGCNNLVSHFVTVFSVTL